ncbi:hypothetical protein BKA00_001122 [Actinomadura coerulea]|uniref:Uncharacterized protein n=1 Tax=Actinomadura coerulea TaxID=46159 RepID=A0A7X0FUZ9_9ACTN|nr:hypothetical protein [Actinomadura coerulea]MBB6394208.1 hypothetical protein [Actinomadura coerulea]GGQ20969.1 hypothetical protein GCM10010187_41770 [Actinomadura coerulea]
METAGGAVHVVASQGEEEHFDVTDPDGADSRGADHVLEVTGS